jgi:hypothetical protein
MSINNNMYLLSQQYYITKYKIENTGEVLPASPRYFCSAQSLYLLFTNIPLWTKFTHFSYYLQVYVLLIVSQCFSYDIPTLHPTLYENFPNS